MIEYYILVYPGNEHITRTKNANYSLDIPCFVHQHFPAHINNLTSSLLLVLLGR